MNRFQRFSRVLLSAVLVSTGSLAAVGGGIALADGPRVCRGTIGDREIERNIVVPAGKTCRLNGTDVDGSVTVRRNATLIANDADIDGRIRSAGANASIIIRRDSDVGGPVLVEDGRRVILRGSDIDDHVIVKRTRLKVTIVNNDVDGRVELRANRGGFHVARNDIDGNLACFRNSTPRTGGGNDVEGRKLGQCRGR
jgi:hypothetical protein